MAQADIIDTLSESAIVAFKADVRAILQRLTDYLRSVLARAAQAGGRLADDPTNVELASKLASGYADLLRRMGYDKALAELLDAYERIAAANASYVEDKLGASYSTPNLRALARLAEKGIEGLQTRAGEAGDRLRDIIVSGAHSNAPIGDLVAKLAEAAGVTLNQAIVEAQTSLMAFHRDTIATESFDAGIDLFTYDGPDDEVMRDFCARYVGKIVTLQDLNDADNGDQPKPVSRFLGGFRCRHSLSPISLEEAQAMYASSGRRVIGPGCTLARRIITGREEGPAAQAFLERNLGTYKRGRVVRRKRRVA